MCTNGREGRQCTWGHPEVWNVYFYHMRDSCCFNTRAVLPSAALSPERNFTCSALLCDRILRLAKTIYGHHTKVLATTVQCKCAWQRPRFGHRSSRPGTFPRPHSVTTANHCFPFGTVPFVLVAWLFEWPSLLPDTQTIKSLSNHYTQARGFPRRAFRSLFLSNNKPRRILHCRVTRPTAIKALGDSSQYLFLEALFATGKLPANKSGFE